MYIYTWPLSFSGVWMPFVVAPLVVYLAFVLASGSVGDVDDLPHRGQSRHSQLGPGPAWPKLQLLAEKVRTARYSNIIDVQAKKQKERKRVEKERGFNLLPRSIRTRRNREK
jgi:hypothetical protein